MVRDGIGFGEDDPIMEDIRREAFGAGLPPFPMPSGKSPRFAAGLADEMLTGGLGDKRINLLALFGDAKFMDRTPKQVLEYAIGGKGNYAVTRSKSFNKELEIPETHVYIAVPNVLRVLPKPVTSFLTQFGGYQQPDPLQGLPLNDLFDMFQVPRRRQEQPLPPSKAVIKLLELVPGTTLKIGYAPRGVKLEMGEKGQRYHTLDVKLSSGDDPSPTDRWSVYVDRVSYDGPDERFLYERKLKK